MGQITNAITALTPALNTATRVIGTIDQVGSLFGGQSSGDREREENLRREQQQSLRQLEQQQSAQVKDLEEQAALDRERLSTETAADEDARRAALRRAVARQRTEFSSRGIGGTGGSSDAVLLGLFEESDSERTERQRLDDIRNRAIDQDVDARKRLNVLQRSQLAERQRLDRAISGF